MLRKKKIMYKISLIHRLTPGLLVGLGSYILVASFPGPACSSLAVRNSRRRPGLVHHVMSATAYVTAISLRINDVIR